MFKSGVEFAKGMIKSTKLKRKQEDYEKDAVATIPPNTKLYINICPIPSAKAVWGDTTSPKSELSMICSPDWPYAPGWSQFCANISLEEEYNRTTGASSLKKYYGWPISERTEQFANSHSYSSTLTKFLINACEAAIEIHVNLQLQNTNIDMESCTGIQNALRVTNSFSKVKLYCLNYNSMVFANYHLNISEQHFALIDLLKDVRMLTIGHAVTCVPAHLIVKWITEWQNHDREIGFLNLDSEEFTDLEKILDAVTFSYKDDGNVYYGIAKRKRKAQLESETILPDEELWFTYWRRFANQKPRIRLSMEKSTRPLVRPSIFGGSDNTEHLPHTII